MITRIGHTDSDGKLWAFVLDCNATQERMFRRFLARLGTIAAQEELRLSYYENEGANLTFRKDVERVVLSALTEKWGAPEARTQAPAATAAPPSPTVAEPEGREPRYWWENL